MILRLSQNLNSKIKAGKLTEFPLDENPFADWSAHLFVVNRAQYILLSNTATLYSCVMFGRGITNDQRFLDGALGTIREFIEEDGLSDIYQNWIAPSTATVTFSKALNRKVTSSINQLVSMATAVLESGEVPPFRVGFELNGFLLSIVAESKKSFGRPREAILRLREKTYRSQAIS